MKYNLKCGELATCVCIFCRQLRALSVNIYIQAYTFFFAVLSTNRENLKHVYLWKAIMSDYMHCNNCDVLQKNWAVDI